MINRIKKILYDRWNCEGGYRELLIVAIPLILTTGSWSIQHFVDRMFLAWYSSEAIAASIPAGFLNFTIISLFMGTANYVNVFIAQYYGAKEYNNIGPIMWQGIYIAIIAGIVHLILIPMAETIFGYIGHDKLVQRDEVIYFQILCLGVFPLICTSTLAGFFTGRGKTMVVMWVNIISTIINLIMNYILIFGKLGFPSLGIKGAGIATVISTCSSLLLYLSLMSRKGYRKRYSLFKGWRLDKLLFVRLIRFGLPSGVQFFLDTAGFTIFVLLIGRLGTNELAASNIAMNINSLAFMPMLGVGISVSILVGQYLGKKTPHIAERSAYSGFHISLIYITLIVFSFLFAPDIFVLPFASKTNEANFESIREITLILIRFIAVYSVFDMFNIVFASAIKGAGDTRFVMNMIVLLSFTLLVLPSYFTIVVLDAGIYAGWTIASTYIIALGLVFFRRFRGGKWKSMSVIEEHSKAE